MLSNSTVYRNGVNGRGCVGGFFRMNGNPANTYGISNNHVIANINNCIQGDPIYDENSGPIGTLDCWVALNSGTANYVDAALFRYTGSGPLKWRMPLPSLNKPLGFVESKLNGHVYMMLENNYCNTGYISDPWTNYSIEFNLCGSKFPFTNIIEITPMGSMPFSVPGESGSIIMSSTHCVVGLLIGTNDERTKSYAIPFVNGILNYLPLVF